MLTIKISKAELKKAFFGGDASFAQELTTDRNPIENENFILLKIILKNIETNAQEVA